MVPAAAFSPVSIPYADPEAPAAFAFRWGDSPSYMPILKKFTALSLQMQGVPAGAEAITETEKLLDLMAPMQSAGMADFEEGLRGALLGNPQHRLLGSVEDARYLVVDVEGIFGD